jgi:hypothetical protein
MRALSKAAPSPRMPNSFPITKEPTLAARHQKVVIRPARDEHSSGIASRHKSELRHHLGDATIELIRLSVVR